ncbi:TPA: sigma-54-dependent Fis family transcriptional regulator [Candidatus Poribacteria bacterium]|nr:sigma-54-dependent Fis family transcriptional regulator [Candidatus Poribacteria bacterium]HIB85876.1 sigma-54-dependent Fis family transcriptional regulator [Candidatus Poribacteria bacterium]
MNNLTVCLIVNSDQVQIDNVSQALAAERLEVVVAHNFYAALDRIERLKVDILITPLKSDRIDGLKLLKAAQQENPDVGIIFISSPKVLAMDLGIKAMTLYETSYFLTEPINAIHLRVFLHKVLENQRLHIENRKLQSQIDDKVGLLQITGNSPQIQEIRQLISQVAPTKATIMICGERGTGKELAARTIHYRSLRKGQLAVLNCAASSESMTESELFGNEQSEDTYHVRKGRFEIANGGTLFLEHVSELSLNNQEKLLHVLRNQEFKKTDHNQKIKIDVRIICSTSLNLEKKVSDGKFMEDLYDRLSMVKIELPPLRNRKEDIPLLTKAFIEEFCRENREGIKMMTPHTLRLLMYYEWKGNVRELRNIIEGIVISSDRNELDEDDLPSPILESSNKDGETLSAPMLAEKTDCLSKTINVAVGMKMSQIEREAIHATLSHVNNNRTKAAEILDISRQTIFRKAKKYSLYKE